MTMNLAQFARDISNTILEPIEQDESEIDMATFAYATASPHIIETEIKEVLVPKYSELPEVKEAGPHFTMWAEARKNIIEDKTDCTTFAQYHQEIDNCKLLSVGKGKYPFECFAKASAKSVNYVKAKKPKLDENGEMVVERKDDLVLAISIYSSEKKTKYLSFFVLGSQTLDTLANSIYCYNNYSENKNHGSYFFFENCFYNSGMLSEAKRRELVQQEANIVARIRHVQAALEKEAGEGNEEVMDVEENRGDAQGEKEEKKDDPSELEQLQNQRQEIRRQLAVDATYAEPITWLRKKHPETVYTTRAMKETRFIDLEIKVGAHYLYCHKGDCEHVLVIENVRAYHHSIANYDSFPVLFYQSKIRRKKCFICKHLPGRIVTSDDNAVSENPCLFCEVCFESLHPEDGPQVSFKRHHYFVDL